MSANTCPVVWEYYLNEEKKWTNTHFTPLVGVLPSVCYGDNNCTR